MDSTGRRNFPCPLIATKEELVVGDDGHPACEYGAELSSRDYILHAGSTSAPANILEQGVDGLDIPQELVRLRNSTLLAGRM